MSDWSCKTSQVGIVVERDLEQNSQQPLNSIDDRFVQIEIGGAAVAAVAGGESQQGSKGQTYRQEALGSKLFHGVQHFLRHGTK